MVVDPRPHYGDPIAIRELASQLEALGDRVYETAQAVVKKMQVMDFEGPKAERFRERMIGGRERAGTLSGEMSHLANSLLLVAAAAQANIDAYEQAVEYNPYEDL